MSKKFKKSIFKISHMYTDKSAKTARKLKPYLEKAEELVPKYARPKIRSKQMCFCYIEDSTYPYWWELEHDEDFLFIIPPKLVNKRESYIITALLYQFAFVYLQRTDCPSTKNDEIMSLVMKWDNYE